MFIRYQQVRNLVIGTLLAAVAAVTGYYGLAGSGKAQPNETRQPLPHAEQRGDADQFAPTVSSSPPSMDSSNQIAQSTPADTVPSEGDFAPTTRSTPASDQDDSDSTTTATATISTQERYLVAMKVASAKAHPSGKGKDVLGPASPWKLNLYDDDLDGTWDRAKLDFDRDEQDDEKWNFKQGQWEKDGGQTIWLGSNWVSKSDEGLAGLRGQVHSPAATASPDSELLSRYRAAMKIASSRADRNGKGKDVLGPTSPWKLNLYDDDRDGQWDRGKLDYDRDEVDDEKWNFKNDQWEKDGGATWWDDDKWVPAK